MPSFVWVKTLHLTVLFPLSSSIIDSHMLPIDLILIKSLGNRPLCLLLPLVGFAKGYALHGQ